MFDGCFKLVIENVARGQVALWMGFGTRTIVVKVGGGAVIVLRTLFLQILMDVCRQAVVVGLTRPIKLAKFLLLLPIQTLYMFLG